jgi:hypothetical protein
MTLISSIDEGVRLIESFEGRPEQFVLHIPETLLDSVGMNMAIITDAILARGWQPNGFEQRQGFRIFRYTELS